MLEESSSSIKQTEVPALALPLDSFYVPGHVTFNLSES